MPGLKQAPGFYRSGIQVPGIIIVVGGDGEWDQVSSPAHPTLPYSNSGMLLSLSSPLKYSALTPSSF